MLGIFKSIFGRQQTEAPRSKRERLTFDEAPAVVYAIGDIHGCFDQLKALEEKIVADASDIEGEKWIICLGDYIDRGPASAAVLDHLSSPPPAGFRRFCLAGNHEEAFLDYLVSEGRREGWLSFGGIDTLASYGLYIEGKNKRSLPMAIQSYMPNEHLIFLESLPEMISIPGYCFVHAGIDPGMPLNSQLSQVLLWSRPQEFDWDAVALDFVVTHGHTPVKEVEFSKNRINVDLGAYTRGILGAVKITATGFTVMLSD
jgi:serine/threonine protein phosphatase 1